MEIQEFVDAAQKEFGDKLMIGGLTILPEVIEKLGISQEQADEYGIQAWLKDNECPKCGSPLFGLLSGTFQWGIPHGIGECSNCHVAIRLYHYIGGKRLEYPALVGF